MREKERSSLESDSRRDFGAEGGWRAGALKGARLLARRAGAAAAPGLRFRRTRTALPRSTKSLLLGACTRYATAKLELSLSTSLPPSLSPSFPLPHPLSLVLEANHSRRQGRGLGRARKLTRTGNEIRGQTWAAEKNGLLAEGCCQRPRQAAARLRSGRHPGPLPGRATGGPPFRWRKRERRTAAWLPAAAAGPGGPHPSAPGRPGRSPPPGPAPAPGTAGAQRRRQAWVPRMDEQPRCALHTDAQCARAPARAVCIQIIMMHRGRSPSRQGPLALANNSGYDQSAGPIVPSSTCRRF